MEYDDDVEIYDEYNVGFLKIHENDWKASRYYPNIAYGQPSCEHGDPPYDPGELYSSSSS